MIRQTFCHIQGVGPATERGLWKKGVRDWDAALARSDLARLHRDVEESQRRFVSKDWKFFDREIPTAEKWRAFGDLGSRVLFVDIETDGGVDGDSITVIGCYDGREAQTFVRGRDLDAAKELIESHPLIVTFNGAQFDMPLIRRRFPYNHFNHVHIDLRFPLKRIGLSGGLKSIERQVGIARGEGTSGLDGWDAVRLWREYESGSTGALELLLDYNREDIRNLLPLMKLAFEKLGGQVAEAMPLPLRCEVIAHGSLRYAEMLELRDEVLRRPLGLRFTPADLAQDRNDVLLACVDGKKLVGCCILTDSEPGVVRLRQMAVSTDRQGGGVGRVLVNFAETVARDRGAVRLFMHARKVAMGFYEKLGYRVCGPEFTVVGLPHFEMEKRV